MPEIGKVQPPPSADPDNVPETLCIGRFTVSAAGAIATITFTHERPKAGPLMDRGVPELESVVRARIVTSMNNLVALRDTLTKVLEKSREREFFASSGTVN